jgi:ribosomal-protein-alanine N-acetyltransferase
MSGTISRTATTGAPEVTLRALTWTDIPALAALEKALFPDDAWSETTWWAELAGRPRRDYVVMERRPGDLAGYAGLDHGGDVADIMTIAVAAAYRGRGLGDRLLDELVARAAAHGAEALMLEVRADSPAALALYARHRFERVSVRRGYYQPGAVDAVVMRRRLP